MIYNNIVFHVVQNNNGTTYDIGSSINGKIYMEKYGAHYDIDTTLKFVTYINKYINEYDINIQDIPRLMEYINSILI